MYKIRYCVLSILKFFYSSFLVFCKCEDVAEPGNVPKNSVKKELQSISNETKVTDENSTSKFPHPLRKMMDNPDFLLKGFYVFSALGLILLAYIVYRTCRLRRSRAENRYGTQAESAQELRPLPLAIEDEDSDNDDQTLFDINSTRTSTRSVFNA